MEYLVIFIFHYRLLFLVVQSLS